MFLICVPHDETSDESQTSSANNEFLDTHIHLFILTVVNNASFHGSSRSMPMATSKQRRHFRSNTSGVSTGRWSTFCGPFLGCSHFASVSKRVLFQNEFWCESFHSFRKTLSEQRRVALVYLYAKYTNKIGNE